MWKGNGETNGDIGREGEKGIGMKTGMEIWRLDMVGWIVHYEI